MTVNSVIDGDKMRYVFFLLLTIGFLSGAEFGAGTPVEYLKPTVPVAMFTRQETAVFEVKHPNGKTLQWYLATCQGKQLQQGTLAAGEKKLVLPQLPCGAYELTLAVDGKMLPGYRGFLVVPAKSERKTSPESYFALASHQPHINHVNGELGRTAWGKIDENKLHLLDADAAIRSGAVIVRDQSSWHHFQNTSGEEFTVSPSNALSSQVRLEGGVKTLIMIGPHFPQWARPEKNSMPDDLVALSDFFCKLASAMPHVAAFEFLNEQDGNNPDPVWHIAAATKAAMYGVRQGNANALRVIGGTARPGATEYDETTLINDLGKYIDAYNKHTYETFPHYPTLCKSILDMLKRQKLSHLPLWITESGSHQTGAGDILTGIKDIRDESKEQELLAGEYMAKMLVLLQSCGVDRDFPFCLPPYNEGTKPWGLLRRDYTAKPALGVFSNFAFHLNRAKLVGELALSAPFRGFLYQQPDKSYSAVIWVISPLDTAKEKYSVKWNGDFMRKPLTLPLHASRKATAVDTFGSPLTVDRGEISVSRLPVIINGLGKLKLKKAIRFPRKHHTADDPAEDLSIILRPRPDLKNFSLSGREKVVLTQKSGRIDLDIVNCSKTAKTGTLFVTGGIASGLPGKITVPPRSTVKVSFDFQPVYPEGKTMTLLDIGGKFNGKAISHARVTVTGFSGDQFYETPLFGTKDPRNWTENTIGKNIFTFDEKENAIRLRTIFPKKFGPYNMWSYPLYTFTLPEDNFRNAVGLRFEFKSDIVPPSKIVHMYLMIAHKNPAWKDVWVRGQYPDNNWRTVTLMLNDPKIHLDNVKSIRLGVNCDQLDFSLYFRNIRVVRKK